MKTLLNYNFIILLAIFGYSVESIKIRAIRRRTIQYVPLKHNQNTQTQYFNWLPQNQRASIYKNSRQTYSDVDPRFNMYSGSGAYGNNLINELNRGQIYQSVHRNWPTTAVQGITVDQNRLNSGYKGLIGQSPYQRWQNSASESPIDNSLQQNGIQPGHIKQTVYQTWQNLADGRPGDDFAQRGNMDLSLFQNLPNSANLRPNDAYIVQNRLNSGNIGQSVFESWHNAASGTPIDITAEQSSFNHGNFKTLQSFQNSAPESLVDLSTEQTILNDISKEQYSQRSGDEGVVNLSVHKIAPNSANGGQINYDTVHDSDNGDQAIILINQGEVDGDHEPQLINEIKVNTEKTTERIHSVSGHDFLYSVDKSKLNQPNKTHLQDIEKDTKENIGSVDTDAQNYLISRDSGGIFSVDQSKLNWPNTASLQNIVKDVKTINEGNNPIGAVNENYFKSADNDDIISVDQSQVNWPIGGPLQDVLKDVHINNEENISPIDAGTQKYLIFPDNDGILSVDKSKFNEAPFHDIFKKMNINKEENISPNGAIAKKYAISPDNEGIISVDQSQMNWLIGSPLQDVMKDVNFSDEENTSQIYPETQNDLMAPINGGILSVDQSKFNNTPLQDIVKEININKEENISPIGAWTKQYPLNEIQLKNGEEINPASIVSEIDLLSPNNENKNTVEQSELNGADQMPLKDIEKDIYKKNVENVLPVKVVTENDQLSSDNIRLLTETKTNANSAHISIVSKNDQVSRNDERVSTLGQTEFNEPTKVPIKKYYKQIITNITENSGPVTQIGNMISNNNDIYGDQSNQKLIPIPIYLNILKSNDQQGQFPRYSNNLKPNQEQSPAPIIFKPNQQRNPGLKTMLNQAVTTREQKSLNIPYEVPPGNPQWNKSIVRNISPQQGSVISSICQNPNANVIPRSERMYYDAKPASNTQEIFELIDYHKKFGLREDPQFVSKSPKIVKYTNAGYTRPIFNKKESYPYYKAGNIDINKYNIRQTSYYIPTPSHSVINKFNLQSANHNTNKNTLQHITNEANEDDGVARKASDNINANFDIVEINPFYKSGNINIRQYSPQQNYYATTSSPAVKNAFDTHYEYFTPDKNPLSQLGIKGRRDYINTSFYKKEIHPYYKLVNTNLNNYNNPQEKYYIPTPPQAVRYKFDIPSDNFKQNENSLRRTGIKGSEEAEVLTNPPDSRVIYIKPSGVRKSYATGNLLHGPPLNSTITKVTEITGYKKPTTPKQYVYQVTKALMPELLGLYHSQYKNGYDPKLIEEFKKLLDSNQGEHCKIE